MKVLKPLDMALLYRAFRFARRDSLALSLMACFRFDAPGGTDSLVPENETWARVEQALGQDGILDQGYPKPAGEYLVYGAACAPHGSEVEQMRVSVRVAGLAKSLVVSGERHFGMSGMPSRPVPYTRMPITPATAFGGAEWAANPSGKGCVAPAQDGGVQQALPNVEYEAKRMLGRNDRPDPAGFWALDSMSPQRRQYLGTCDERWAATDWPHLPADTRQQFFMSAPSDQWLASGYFTGDETFDIQNMDARRPLLQGRLPGLRARCFVYGPMPASSASSASSGSSGSVVREVEARADTVWLFPELGCGIVLYRAMAAVTDSDASDVTHMLAAWETLTSAPLPFEHYRDQLLDSLRKAADATPAESAPPPVAPAAAALVPEMPAAPIPAEAAQELAQVQSMTADLNRQTDAFMSQHGLTAKDLEPFLKFEEPPAPVSLAEVERMTAAQNARTQAFMQTHGLSDADLAPFLKAADPGPEASLADLPAMAAKMQDATREMLQKAGMTEAEVSGWLAANPATASLAALPQPGTPLPAVDPAALAALATLPKTPGLPPAPELAAPPLPAPASPTAQLTREQVVARHAARESLAGYDLSGVDLSALDLSGADFSSALLEKTSFAKSTLQAAKFTQALLKETDFSGADLQRAELVDTSGGSGKFADADLRAAKLTGGDFSKADFGAARLGEARLDRALFSQAKMAGVDASACHAHETQFDAADLTGANFRGASLDRATFRESALGGVNFENAACEHVVFHGAQAQKAVFTGANLAASRAQSACFDGAQFAGANLGRANWQGTQLRGANFAGALLDHADFSGAQAVTATFRRASAQGAKFAKADLSGADLSAVNLFKGSLRKAKIDGTLLTHANLYGVNFDETQPTLAAVEGSNIERTILKFRPPVV
ncbi:DUF2169 family type VI secretion system accessory protein [Caballeronia insecticola]|uniref:Pentapeptide repeat protein n=1 Tax=Caballeronia insecticola TaxID=758793 RepID=R4X266_9BURK|nr:DUF2169 domain-containing protein [Caballeronia insecticola]BAN26546.1 pentapeptide repeat protein [Caballeronia insecticola]